jgi:mannosyltransferase
MRDVPHGKEPTQREARMSWIGQRWPGRGRWPLVAAMVAAAVLRLLWIGRPSLWYDEVVPMTLARTSGPAALFRLLFRIEATRAPLHPLLLQAWLRLTGQSDVAGRLFSVLCGVATVWLVYRIGRRAFNRPTAQWGAALCAISPYLVHYSREVKMYAWLVFLTCLAWDLLLSFRRSDSAWRKAGFALTSIALVYSHPLGTFMVAALGAAYLAQHRRLRLSLRDWMAIQTLVALACLPWLPNYVDHEPEYLAGKPSIRALFGWVSFISGGTPLLLPVWFALIELGLWNGRRSQRIGPTALLCWFAIPPVLLFGYSVLKHPLIGPPRYVLFVAPAYLLLVARGAVALPRPARGAAALVCLAAAVSMLWGKIYDPTFEFKHDWRGVATIIAARDPRADVVFLRYYPTSARARTDLHEVTLRYYLAPGITVRKVYSDSPGTLSCPLPSALWLVDGPLDRRPIHEAIARNYETAGTWTLRALRVTYYLEKSTEAPDVRATASPRPAILR